MSSFPPGIKIPFTEHLGVELVEMTKEHAVVDLVMGDLESDETQEPRRLSF